MVVGRGGNAEVVAALAAGSRAGDNGAAVDWSPPGFALAPPVDLRTAPDIGVTNDSATVATRRAWVSKVATTPAIGSKRTWIQMPTAAPNAIKRIMVRPAENLRCGRGDVSSTDKIGKGC